MASEMTNKPDTTELELRLAEAYEMASEARWIAWRFRNLIRDFPADLDDIDLELAEFIYSDSHAHEWIDGPEGATRFGAEGPK